MKQATGILWLILTVSVFGCNNEAEIHALNKYYSIREGKVFFKDINPLRKNELIELSQASAKHFRLIPDESGNIAPADMPRAADNMNVYYKDLILKGADPHTFTLLKDGFSKDADNVFFKDKTLAGADANSFTVLSNYYAKDKNRLWFGQQPVSDSIRLSSFRIIDGYFSCDSHHVYLNKGSEIQVFEEATPYDFSKACQLSESSGIRVYFDAQKVYILNTEKALDAADFISRIEADINSFRILNQAYTKDAYSVFFNGKAIEGANSESFELFQTDSSDARDALHIYYKGKTIAERDTAQHD